MAIVYEEVINSKVIGTRENSTSKLTLTPDPESIKNVTKDLYKGALSVMFVDIEIPSKSNPTVLGTAMFTVHIMTKDAPTLETMSLVVRVLVNSFDHEYMETHMKSNSTFELNFRWRVKTNRKTIGTTNKPIDSEYITFHLNSKKSKIIEIGGFNIGTTDSAEIPIIPITLSVPNMTRSFENSKDALSIKTS